MTMNKHLSRVAAALIAALVLLVAVPASAQTALTSTTLSAALSDSSTSAIVASATSITAPGSGATQVALLIDRELVRVTSVSGTVIGITRGADGSRASTHVSGATVTVAPALAVKNYVPSGQCTRSTLQYVPLIVGGSAGLGVEVGSTYDCLGATTAGQWAQTNANGVGVLGSTMASTAGVLGLPTGTVFTVSGTNAITGITLPAGAAPGFRISIVPSAIFTWTAATNIALAGTAVVNKLLEFVWNGSKWVPSYIA